MLGYFILLCFWDNLLIVISVIYLAFLCFEALSNYQIPSFFHVAVFASQINNGDILFVLFWRCFLKIIKSVRNFSLFCIATNCHVFWLCLIALFLGHSSHCQIPVLVRISVFSKKTSILFISFGGFVCVLLCFLR